mmetsp:Transcript_14296/g.25116  ORF Transcript_14296/g.25116 Transcript_14296/m.25116 type:complete len:97 (+) Transcript_14296:37-327(+)
MGQLTATCMVVRPAINPGMPSAIQSIPVASQAWHCPLLRDWPSGHLEQAVSVKPKAQLPGLPPGQFPAFKHLKTLSGSLTEEEKPGNSRGILYISA